MRFEIRQSQDEQFYFNLIARNHEVIATSETYTRKENAFKTANLIANEEIFEIIDMTKEENLEKGKE